MSAVPPLSPKEDNGTFLLTHTAVSPISHPRSYSTSPKPNGFGSGLSPAERAEQRRKEQADTLARAMDRTLARVWQKGDVYAPHDLSAAEARKWRKRHAPTMDAFDALSLNPLNLYKVRHPPPQIQRFVVWQGGIDMGIFRTSLSCPNT